MSGHAYTARALPARPAPGRSQPTPSDGRIGGRRAVPGGDGADVGGGGASAGGAGARLAGAARLRAAQPPARGFRGQRAAAPARPAAVHHLGPRARRGGARRASARASRWPSRSCCRWRRSPRRCSSRCSPIRTCRSPARPTSRPPPGRAGTRPPRSRSCCAPCSSPPADLRPLVSGIGAAFAAAVGCSLLILAWHMPSDVFGGYLVAALWMALAVAGLRAAERRWPPARSAPALRRPAGRVGAVRARDPTVTRALRRRRSAR